MHDYKCKCRACALRAELASFKMHWCWAMHWRMNWRDIADSHLELVEAIGPDAEGGRA